MKVKSMMAKVLDNSQIAEGIFDMKLACRNIAAEAKPGQFITVACGDYTLRRPISICEIDVSREIIRIVYEVRGKGTEWLSHVKTFDSVDIIAPLGNGYDLTDHRSVLFVGGGIGVPPLLATAKRTIDATAILGFRNKSAIILENDFKKACNEVLVTTDDGSNGIKGFTTDAMKLALEKKTFDLVCACGPIPMLKKVAAIAAEHNIPCQVSLEERMACGVGACLVCACKVKSKDGTEEYKRVCKDGPVFDAAEVF